MLQWSFCTHQFVIVGLELYDLDGERIQLDSSKTSLNSKVIFSKDYSTEASTYHSVITDSEYVEVDFSGTEVTFTGWLDGQQIVEQDFIIGKDCCHIEKNRGARSYHDPLISSNRPTHTSMFWPGSK